MYATKYENVHISKVHENIQRYTYAYMTNGTEVYTKKCISIYVSISNKIVVQTQRSSEDKSGCTEKFDIIRKLLKEAHIAVLSEMR